MEIKYEIGSEIPRDNKTPLIICGYTAEGTYLLHLKRVSVKSAVLAKFFEIEKLTPGAILRLNGRQIILTKDRKTGYWECVDNEILELAESEIEEMLADANSRQIYSSVATRRETGESRNLRFLPRRMDNEPRE